ncbi:hypothetical protein PHYBOEH_003483 [Phytophthora boehmeriae]|uniref:Uncharacterized protein n=1 Tax=Phytophthora boehmeriae TaxID=109152 RepID=A0A8T1XA00_9STRA|nr:hypothetical protein PHYBOEH_003483 [Phytophthora boehmeriae]
MLASTTPAAKEPPLPVFSTKEARFRKARDANTLIFSVPTHSSVLLPLLRPASHAYEQRDARWLHLLQAAALVPSRKADKLAKTLRQALKMPLSPRIKSELETLLNPLLAALETERPGDDFHTKCLVALQVKEKVAAFLRQWIAEPVEGFVLRKEHVVNGMRLDDLVATPAGAGYLRAYRTDDGFCTVVYPWGHGFVHVKDVEKVQRALEKQLKKRSFNEYVALEHQQMYEQIEGLLENLPPVQERDTGEETMNPNAVKAETVDNEADVAEYKELLTSLEEEHVDTTVLRQDLSFLRRVQALATKTKEIRRAQTAPEPQQKMARTDEPESSALEQQEPAEAMQTEVEQEQQEEQQQAATEVEREQKQEQ